MLIIALLMTLLISSLGAFFALTKGRDGAPSASESPPLPTPSIDGQTPKETETASFALG
ncbi:MAG: hypothetical protein R6V13_10270 [Anaerolineae bacterium]